MELTKFVVDFTVCHYPMEMELIVMMGLGLPVWYGHNLDALWDALTWLIDTPCEITVRGVETLPEDMRDYGARIIEVMRRAAETGEDEISIVVETGAAEELPLDRSMVTRILRDGGETVLYIVEFTGYKERMDLELAMRMGLRVLGWRDHDMNTLRCMLAERLLSPCEISLRDFPTKPGPLKDYADQMLAVLNSVSKEWPGISVIVEQYPQ
ncbi:MAG: barstar family protein [Clostridiales bacterium]|nr:barstar family protein [Clostridiales bacterium]